MSFNEIIDVDLPSLQSIRLGRTALHGESDESSSLKMKCKNEMIRIV